MIKFLDLKKKYILNKIKKMKNLIFIGTNNFASKILEELIKKKIKISLVISKIDSKIGRYYKKNPHPVSIVSENFDVPLYKTENINEKKSEIFIKDVSPELIILVEYGEKINNNIIKIPNYGIWNLHPSLLPDYRGAMPIQYSILNGDFQTGVTLIKINDIIDGGKIINYKKCKISADDNFLNLSQKLVKCGIDCITESLNNFKINSFKKNKKKMFSHSYKLNKDFYKIDWRDSALNINKKIKAFYGIKKFSAKINSVEFKIIETDVKISNEITNQVPGKILNIKHDGIYISTGLNIICIKKIQFPGKKIINIKDLINSRKNLFKICDNLE